MLCCMAIPVEKLSSDLGVMVLLFLNIRTTYAEGLHLLSPGSSEDLWNLKHDDFIFREQASDAMYLSIQFGIKALMSHGGFMIAQLEIERSSD